MTIDGEDARDFDDAYSVNVNGRRLAVAGSDCRCLILCPSGKRLDPEAHNRGNLGLFP